MSFLGNIVGDIRKDIGLQPSAPAQGQAAPIIDARPAMQPSQFQPMQQIQKMPQQQVVGQQTQQQAAYQPMVSSNFNGQMPNANQAQISVGSMAYHPAVGLHYPVQVLPRMPYPEQLPRPQVRTQ